MEAIKVNANGGLQKILLRHDGSASFDGTCDVGTDGGVDFGASSKAASSVYQGAIFVQKPDGDNSSALAVYQGANTIYGKYLRGWHRHDSVIKPGLERYTLTGMAPTHQLPRADDSITQTVALLIV